MKKRFLILPFIILALILTFTLLPVSFISANPGNLVQDSGFDDGLNWCYEEGNVDIVNLGGSHNNVLHIDGDDTYDGNWYQYWEGAFWQIHTSNKNLTFSLDYCLLDYDENGEDGGFGVGYNLYDESFNPLGSAYYWWQDNLNTWYRDGDTISNMWADTHSGASLPDFSWIEPYVGTWYIAEAYYDNVTLTYDEPTTYVEPVWVRTQEMTCKRVWINEDNKFQFSFIYPYRDNNWVRIYDMSGKMVYEIDMPYDNPNIIVDLPDGMYTVKTFHDKPEPLQTFVIGKP
jgi:hypothetical protein